MPGGPFLEAWPRPDPQSWENALSCARGVLVHRVRPGTSRGSSELSLLHVLVLQTHSSQLVPSYHEFNSWFTNIPENVAACHGVIRSRALLACGWPCAAGFDVTRKLYGVLEGDPFHEKRRYGAGRDGFRFVEPEAHAT